MTTFQENAPGLTLRSNGSQPFLLSEGLTVILAVVLPTLIAFNRAPSATIFNQVAAVTGWGVFLLFLGIALPVRVLPRSAGAAAASFAITLVLFASMFSPLWASTPWPLELSFAGTLLAALLTLLVGVSAIRAGLGDRAFTAFCIALLTGGCACAAIGLIQVFEPAWPDGVWIAPGPMNGRAIGNLRQTNHLSSFLLWAGIAAIWLGEAGVVRRAVACAALLVFIFVVFLTGSRTGMVGTGALAIWGLLDRRLSRASRIALVLMPIAYALMWRGEIMWSSLGHEGFGAASRPIAGDNITSSRTSIWSNAITLIRSHPLTGVGVGEFNFAWTLTPFPGRPNEFFDHTHNIVLNLAVEFGLPLATIVVSLLVYGLYAALRNAIADGRPDPTQLYRPLGQPPVQRAAFMMVAMIGLHSMLEYPLWYAYFLLPTAFAFGLCLERPDRRDMPDPNHPHAERTRPIVLAAMVMIMAGALTLVDYFRVAAIFAAPKDGSSLADRIESGQHSVLFAHHADYAAATIAEHPSTAMSAFKGAPHFLLDARLMIAWARALNESGDVERARYIAQRAKEFSNADEAQFFAPCSKMPKPATTELPFQCTPPTRAFTFEDFR